MTNCMVRRNNLDVIHNINLKFREMQPPVIASPSTVLLSRISDGGRRGRSFLKFGINEILHSFHL